MFFILTVSLLSWYHWSDSVWVEETRQRIRDRAEESRHKREERVGMDRSDVSTKSFDDEEDISIIEEKSLLRSNSDDSEDIEELSGFSEEVKVRKRKVQPKEAGGSSSLA